VVDDDELLEQAASPMTATKVTAVVAAHLRRFAAVIPPIAIPFG
jgi:hypothetical protein